MIDALTRPEAIETARRMYAAGWTVAEIQRYVTRRGVKASWHAVKGWVDDDYAQRRRARERDRQRDLWRIKNGARPVAYKVITNHDKLIRLCELREAGLSPAAVATVIRLDFGDELTKNQVSYAHRVGEWPKRIASGV